MPATPPISRHASCPPTWPDGSAQLQRASTPRLNRRAGGQTVGRLVAQAVADFEQRLLGRPPRHVTVTHGAGLLVVSLQQPLTPIERELAADPAGSRRLEDFHHDLFSESRPALRDHVAAATGVDLAAAVLDIDLDTGCLLKTFSTGPAIDLYLFGPPAPLLGVPIDWHVHAEAVRRQTARLSDHPTP